MPVRRVQPQNYLYLSIAFICVLYLAHSPYFGLPYFWDELGQFVPGALDFYHDGSLIPHSAVPNVHPPGVMAWIALVWKFAGVSIPATRSAMLLLGAVGALFCFMLSIQMSRGLSGAPAFLSVLLLIADPLFYTQSMMAQLDMPAMVFTLAGLLFFLQNRVVASAVACTVLVSMKETGVVLPVVLACWLLQERGRAREAAWFAAPVLVLAAWIGFLWNATGHPFGDPGFTHYNTVYALHPVRAASSLIRRGYYLFVADFRWVGSIAIAYGWRRGLFGRPGWKITGIFALAHVLEVSLLGGAQLERYLLPVLPLFYIAAAAAWTLFSSTWRNVSVAVMAAGLLLGFFVNPPYPFPFENNLAMADFIGLHRAAASYLEESYANRTIHTAWPLTAALRDPEFGYVHRGLRTVETSDLHYSTLSRLDPEKVDVLVLYSRTWEPEWSVLRLAWVRGFLSRFYDYEPQMTPEQFRGRLGLKQVMMWTRRGQWIAVYTKDPAAAFPVVNRKPSRIMISREFP